MKPFDLERALSGDAVMDVLSGMESEVIGLTYFDDVAECGGSAIVFKRKLDRSIYVLSKDGKNTLGRQRLFMAPIKKEGWIILYTRTNVGLTIFDCVYDTFEQAKKEAEGMSNVISVTKIEWDE